MGRKEDNIARATEVMHKRDKIRNLAIAAHIDHGKTTLSDNLIAGAGMMSEDLNDVRSADVSWKRGRRQYAVGQSPPTRLSTQLSDSTDATRFGLRRRMIHADRCWHTRV